MNDHTDSKCTKLKYAQLQNEVKARIHTRRDNAFLTKIVSTFLKPFNMPSSIYRLALVRTEGAITPF